MKDSKCCLYLKRGWHKTLRLPQNSYQVASVNIMKEQRNVRKSILEGNKTKNPKKQSISCQIAVGITSLPLSTEHSLQIKFDITFTGSKTDIQLLPLRGSFQCAKIKKANFAPCWANENCNLGLLKLSQKQLEITRRIFPNLKFFKIKLRRIKVYDRK